MYRSCCFSRSGGWQSKATSLRSEGKRNQDSGTDGVIPGPQGEPHGDKGRSGQRNEEGVGEYYCNPHWTGVLPVLHYFMLIIYDNCNCEVNFDFFSFFVIF